MLHRRQVLSPRRRTLTSNEGATPICCLRALRPTTRNWSQQLRAEIERLRALMPATTAIPASVLDASIAALVSERDRLRAALTEILEFDPHPTAKDVARRALGLETTPKL